MDAFNLNHSARFFNRNRRIGVGVANHKLDGLAEYAAGLVDVLDRQQESVPHLNTDLRETTGEIANERNLQWPRLVLSLLGRLCLLTRWPGGLGLLHISLRLLRCSGSCLRLRIPTTAASCKCESHADCGEKNESAHVDAPIDSIC